MPDNPYGQTDVMHDENYLRALMQNPRTRKQGEQGLKNLQRERSQQQRAEQFGLRQMRSEQEGERRQQAREDTLQARRDALTTQEQGRSDRAAALNQLRETAEKDRVAQGIARAAEMTVDPAERKALMTEYYKRLGIADPTAPQPGGVPTGVHPALAQWAAGKAAATQPAVQPVSNVQPVTPIDQATGVGTGVASPEAVRAYREGHSVTSLGGITMTTLPGGGFAGTRAVIPPSGRIAPNLPNPPTNENMLPTPVTNYALATPPAGPPKSDWTTGVGHIGFAPSSLVGQPQPSPNPTPSGPQSTGPFSGSIGQITQGPVPTPAGTPPAIPLPTPNPVAKAGPAETEEDRRRRLLAGQ